MAINIQLKKINNAYVNGALARLQSGRRHVGAAHRFDLFNFRSKVRQHQDLVELANDFVENSQAVHAVVVLLAVEVAVVGDCCKHDSAVVVLESKKQ